MPSLISRSQMAGVHHLENSSLVLPQGRLYCGITLHQKYLQRFLVKNEEPTSKNLYLIIKLLAKSIEELFAKSEEPVRKQLIRASPN